MARRRDDQQLTVKLDPPPKTDLSRRNFLERSSAALAVAATLPILASAQQTRDLSGDDHKGINETQPGPINKTLDASDADSVFPPTTDAGGQPPFKYPFSFAHKRVEEGGWTRQVTARDLAISKKVAGGER